ncbi:MAG TPA: ATP-binding protein [Sedimentisphaerales bacterium]|nr:ATP-binding protein [Sedimentisphaerales bacterium]
MVSKAPISCSIVVESRPSAIEKVCEQILSKLKANGFDKDDIFAVHLALEEAFLNAVKHGNKMDPTKEVKIDYSVGLDKIEISVTDEGEGFEPEAVADPRYGESLYKPGGRGLLLINSYMDMVKFTEQGNGLYMVRYKEKPSLTKRADQTKV